ncbi:MAG: hypothetical protein HKN47_01905 [Pirellulaceae bacterium]|nr:hypothetical protein [Pirellulaceae bacterium]
MNCNDFDDWLQQQLDERSGLQMSDEIGQHVDRCDHCRGHWNAWQQIAATLPVDDGFKAVEKVLDRQVPAVRVSVWTSARDAVALVAALAAILMVSFFIRGSETATQSVAQVDHDHAIGAGVMTGAGAVNHADGASQSGHADRLSSPSESDPRTAERKSPDMDPSLWWRRIQSRDWIAQTMPAMQSVRDGVAPLGRSLVNAVTILAIGPRERTS